jgi:hypothetical protein
MPQDNWWNWQKIEVGKRTPKRENRWVNAGNCDQMW